MATDIALGNHAPDWEPTAADVPADAPGDSTLEEIGKVMALGATASDMTSAFGEPVDEGNGKVRWSIDKRTDPQAFGKWKELSAPKRRAEIERSLRWNASMRRVQMVDPKTGAVDQITEEMEESVGRTRGLRRHRPFAGMNKVERGPDGMLFRHAGTWLPTGRTCLGAPLDPNDDGVAHGLQRDPRGIVWMCRAEQWRELMDGDPLTEDEMRQMLGMED